MKDMRKLEEIWAKFVYEDELDPSVQPAVADGWRRCKDAGVNPIGGRGRRVTDEVFASIREANAELIDAAMPIMQSVFDIVRRTGFLMVLTDGAEYTQTLEVDLNAMSYNENTGLMNVLESLRLQEKLTYAAESSAYGAFLTAVGGLTQDERAGRYLTVYTSVEKDKGTFEAENHVYTDKNGAEVICYPSGVGVSAMTIQDGCVVVITYVTY